MRLRLMLPTEILLDVEARKIVAEAPDGSFCLLPRHVDFVSALAPGLLSYEAPDGREVFAAVDEGVLVKCADEVLVSTERAVTGADLGSLRELVERQFGAARDHERAARSAMARLEAGFVRRFLHLGRGDGG